MLVKTIKWFFATLAGLILVLVGVLEVGARMSLDTDYQHTHSTAALPVFSPHRPTGLVRIAANGYEFRARVAGFEQAQGDAVKPAVILLHGFPVTSAMWNPLIGPLTDAGYRVLAFDQRGYSPGARPIEISDYTVDKLASDVIAVADAAGLEQFHLIGHDWGAVVGWSTVLRHPQRVKSWTGLSISHPAAFSEALQHDPDQRARSSYFLLFAAPWLPHTLFSFNDFNILNRVYSAMAAPQVAEYMQVFSEPGALSAAFNWYRAALVSSGAVDELPLQVNTPTLFIWGNNDQAVGRFSVEAQAQYMQGPYREVELSAGHWLLEDSESQVIDEVMQHLATYGGNGVQN